jgi:hypothetical protein
MNPTTVFPVFMTVEDFIWVPQVRTGLELIT